MISQILKVILIFGLFICIRSFSNVAIAQSFTVITNADDCEVFVDGLSVGVGKKVTVKFSERKNLSQIKVARPDYKPEFNVIYKGEKEIRIYVLRKSLQKEKAVPPIIAFVNLGINPIVRTYHYDFIKARTLYYDVVDYKCKNCSDERNYHIEGLSNGMKGLASTGYIDTNLAVLHFGNDRSLLEAGVNSVNILYLQPSQNCYNIAMNLEVEMSYIFNDNFGKQIFKGTKKGKSGVYSLDEIQWKAMDCKEQLACTEKYFQEAIANSFYDMIADSAFKDVFSDKEKLSAIKMEVLTLKPNSFVTDMKSALGATVTITADKSFGSGCVVSNDGYILTSYHVISETEDSLIKVITNKGDTLNCKVNRTSKKADLAILKVEKSFPFAFKLDENSEFEVADEVIAIGTPAYMELSQTVSKGIISGLRNSTDGIKLIQTDVSVSPGNSGGPLIRRPATFLGVVNSKISGNRVEGLGFCTPVSDVIEFLKLKVN
ncbi:MAG: trypsin-like peptidase domain-containing protein [Bacteroidetes bacterium]|nr:trypsin-like peptidase domain-containing protein [Bacteroidota bacterium]